MVAECKSQDARDHLLEKLKNSEAVFRSGTRPFELDIRKFRQPADREDVILHVACDAGDTAELIAQSIQAYVQNGENRDRASCEANNNHRRYTPGPTFSVRQVLIAKIPLSQYVVRFDGPVQWRKTDKQLKVAGEVNEGRQPFPVTLKGTDSCKLCNSRGHNAWRCTGVTARTLSAILYPTEPEKVVSPPKKKRKLASEAGK